MSNASIGNCLNIHPNQVGKYIAQYKEAGIASLCSTNYVGQVSELDAHAEKLLASFNEKPPLSLAEARHRIIELTGITRDISRVEAFLKRHSFSYRKCGYVPGKVNPEAQQEWLTEKLEPEIESAQKGTSVLLFMDAAHFVLSQFCCMMWCVVRVFIRSGAGRNRINVLGALNATTQNITTLINTSYINAEVIMAFLQQLRDEYGQIPITIVLDNARYQHCKAVKAFAEALDIHLLFLPAYSPNLNIIERLWKFSKRTILYGKYFDSPEKFHCTIRDFFQNIHNYNDQLKTLLTLKFQLFDQSRIYAP